MPELDGEGRRIKTIFCSQDGPRHEGNQAFAVAMLPNVQMRECEPWGGGSTRAAPEIRLEAEVGPKGTRKEEPRRGDVTERG